MENHINQLEVKTATMAQQLSDLEKRNTSEHKEIIKKINEIGITIKCFATQKDLNDIKDDVEKLKSWFWKIFGAMGVILFLIQLFRDKIFN